MKYFTKDLIERYGSTDEATAHAADAEWEAALDRYEQALRAVEPDLPDHIRAFTKLLLNGALVWSIARQGDKLLMVLRKDIPPRDMVYLTYNLVDEPVIDREALSPEHRSQVMDYRYDEFELIRQGDRRIYAQSILFGNGWEMTLRFRDVQVSLAEAVYPPAGAVFVPMSPSIAARPA